MGCTVLGRISSSWLAVHWTVRWAIKQSNWVEKGRERWKVHRNPFVKLKGQCVKDQARSTSPSGCYISPCGNIDKGTREEAEEEEEEAWHRDHHSIRLIGVSNCNEEIEGHIRPLISGEWTTGQKSRGRAGGPVGGLVVGALFVSASIRGLANNKITIPYYSTRVLGQYEAHERRRTLQREE